GDLLPQVDSLDLWINYWHKNKLVYIFHDICVGVVIDYNLNCYIKAPATVRFSISSGSEDEDTILIDAYFYEYLIIIYAHDISSLIMTHTSNYATDLKREERASETYFHMRTNTVDTHVISSLFHIIYLLNLFYYYYYYKTLSCDYIKYYFIFALFTIMLTNGHLLITEEYYEQIATLNIHISLFNPHGHLF
ncbi:hypothetical protein ACJX0J_015638, partial [Zea mays]